MYASVLSSCPPCSFIVGEPYSVPSGEEYIKSLIANPALVDRLALTSDDKVCLSNSCSVAKEFSQKYTNLCAVKSD